MDEASIAQLYYYQERANSLDLNALKIDAYLDYSKKLSKNYFIKQNEK